MFGILNADKILTECYMIVHNYIKVLIKPLH